MFEALAEQPSDSLLALIKAFAADPRPGKIDLGVGVYRDEEGRTPVMAAVKAAETILLREQDSKSYLGPEGDVAFVERLAPIVLGAEQAASPRLAGIQTPGGSGALRLGAELVAAARPGARVWLGMPSWPNHAPVLKAGGLVVTSYEAVDLAGQTLLFEAMIAALSQAAAGDVVLLHGCCHNPTGIDPDAAQWRVLADLVARRGLVPFVDLAYQGLGRGLEEDAEGLRTVLAAADEALVAYSCDKNFGLYRDRTGALYVLARDARAAGAVASNLKALSRVNWSMPPDHGAAAVRLVLERDDLAAQWRGELAAMAERIRAVRTALAAREPRLAFVAAQNGLFSNLAIDRSGIEALRARHGVYMAGSGRINLAGLRLAEVDRLVAALDAVGAFAGAH